MMLEVVNVMSRPWAWGRADCWTAACDVFWREHGFDPMADHRGTYDSAAGAARIVAEAGGMVPLAAATFGAVGLVRGATGPAALAVAPIEGGREALCVHVGDGYFAGKTERGFALLRDVAEVWSCPK